jgi:hypothetical protein
VKFASPHKRSLSRIILIFLTLTIAGVLLILSCKDQNTGPTSDIVFPDSLISYSKYVEPLFSQTCTGSRCHGGEFPSKGLNLEPPSYSSLMNHQPQLVVGGAPSNSLLVQRLEGTIPPIMPSNQNPLTDNQKNGIRKWISEGAKNN